MEVYVDQDHPEYVMVSGDYVCFLQSKINKAINIATEYGMTDGAHHKQWVIDQMLRTLLGEKPYEKWLDKKNSDPNYDPWDQGVP
jgi:hypothetical protein